MSARTVEERCRAWLRERGCPSVTECHASMAEFVTSLLAEAVAGERERLVERAMRPRGRHGFRGCGDNSCLIQKPSGMATNGGCRCPAGKVQTAIVYALRAAPKEDR